MPEPNLPPLIAYEDNASLPLGIDVRQAVVLEAIRKRLPELPGVKRDRLVRSYGILPEHSFTLVVSFLRHSHFHSSFFLFVQGNCFEFMCKNSFLCVAE